MSSLAEQYEEARQAVEQMKAQQAALQLDIDRNTKLLHDVQAMRDEVAAKHADLDKRNAALAASYRQLTQAQAAHEALKQSFLKGQAVAEMSIQQREKGYIERQKALDALTAVANAKHTELGQREEAVAALEAKYNTAREHAQRFLDAVA